MVWMKVVEPITVRVDEEKEHAEFSLPSGCLVCDGPVEVRALKGGVAYVVCPRCHAVTRSELRGGPGNLELRVHAASA